MKVKLQDAFLKKLNRQVLYIASDKPTAARKFKNDILQKCHNLKDNPYKFRKSIYFDRDDIRDMTFRGYTIVYKIETEVILVFALLKQEKDI